MSAPDAASLQTVDDVLEALAARGYLADRTLATSVLLAIRLGRPLLLEGEAGVGKTELAKVLSQVLDTELIRLQCYEGLDISQAAYEWNIARQMLEIRIAEATGAASRGDAFARSLYRRELLIERPLLRSLTGARAPVLLIDELDRADEPFEAFLLEILSDFQITVPELGPIRAQHPPVVILTSNRTREIHDALKRRCLYAWVDYPDAARELAIVREKVPGANERLAVQVVEFVQQMRRLDLFKAAGIAETIDWTNALVALNAIELDPASINDTLGVLLKYQDDIARMQNGDIGQILETLRAKQLLA
ncbi:MAG: AAA family ATPase [Lautropia sp.]